MSFTLSNDYDFHSHNKAEYLKLCKFEQLFKVIFFIRRKWKNGYMVEGFNITVYTEGTKISYGICSETYIVDQTKPVAYYVMLTHEEIGIFVGCQKALMPLKSFFTSFIPVSE